MSEKSYNHQDIMSYLLGSLPENETEVFDELSITDDEFADQLQSVEQDLVDAYVNGELSDTNLKQFKSNYLSSPLRREKVAFAESFQTFAERHLEKEIIEAETPAKTGFFSKLFSIPPLALQWGFALAVLALILSGGWLFWRNSDSRPEIGQTHSNRQIENQLPAENSNQPINAAENKPTNLNQEPGNSTPDANKPPQLERSPQKEEPKPAPSRPIAKPEPELAVKKTPEKHGTGTGFGSPAQIATLFLLPSLRSGNKLPTIKITPKTTAAELELQLEFDDFQRYRIILQNPSDQKMIWQRLTTSVKKGKVKVLRFQIPADLFKPNIYNLEVSGISPTNSSEIIGNYSFRVVQ